MRVIGLLLLASAALAQGKTPPFQPVATISQIMVAITLPYSDALLYIQRNPPKDDRDWEALQMQALMLAESGNLLMIQGRAKNQGQWMKDARLLVEACDWVRGKRIRPNAFSPYRTFWLSIRRFVTLSSKAFLCAADRRTNQGLGKAGIPASRSVARF